MSRSHTSLSALLLSSFLAGAGCTGNIAGPLGPDDPGGTSDPGPKGNGGKGQPGSGGGSGGLIDTPGMPGAPNQGKACTPGPLAATPRLMRLTRMQYENSVRDLTGLDVRPARDLPPDTTILGFNRGVDLEVGDILGRVFREQAESVAKQVVASAAAMKNLVPCDSKTGDACMKTFVAEFGKKVFRRPLTDAEKARYEGLFKQGNALLETGDAFAKGVQVTIEAMLQSPHFLYRHETSTKREGDVVALGSHELASRLSYMLANTTPDAPLMAAADKNELADPAVLATHARRLLDTPGGKATVRDFFGQWLGADDWENHLDKSAMKYPLWKASLLPTLKQELDLYAEAVTFERKKGLATLLTAPFTYVNKGTAPIYGVNGTFGDAMTRVDLDPAQRAGILTQIGFLASHASSTVSSPIHRGVFVQRALLCTTIPPPGEQVPPLPPTTAGKTTRQVVTEHTDAPGCKECHKIINPVGFGLEHFDAIGAWRSTESEQAIDASGSLVGTAKNLPFTNGVELAKAVVESPESRLCYATQWLRYSFGREEKDGDTCALEALATSIASDAYTPVDLMVDMVRSRAFMYRSAEGL